MVGRVARHGIVVGVDGSAPSRMAVQWAARDAVMRKLPLFLVHVIYAAVPVPAEPSHAQKAVGQKLIDEARNVIEGLAGEAGPQIESEVSLGQPVSTLVELSKQAQMVVVGCQGQSLLDRILLGSVSSGVVQRAYCPVAVVHNESLSVLEEARLPVLLGIDGSPASEFATEIAFEEACYRGVELIALHAWCDAGEFAIGSTEWSAHQAGAAATLAERLAGWQERYPDVIVRRRIVSSHPARHLLDAAESAQLVVVGNRGRGGFALLGSVSTAVVQAARVPVIVARPSSQPGSEDQ
ncbi:universal stress protein [Mycobacterium shimoidei]|uniref:Universal stress protein family protein [Mycobacterium tuberculosis H37Rv] n=1 Tax=Mycobacterium shimoidei TaxID=29313 RepID=A0A1E3THS5_MYCSH|nr:universal stress protein [Mycobacterium shimoidei]MCV7257516.1 universal stress protein [Mycobacterium shimoidei]ODR13989.1 universal stress protein UspA [Mycobacterium shimoidei]ORW82542.1 universal stress protein UspA [Mycobacterium shimoidei]SRX94152.1 Universal stress protein family protein [Mycobacterium tuberculosis H37Rv] [Mycobacterium shimoidei]